MLSRHHRFVLVLALLPACCAPKPPAPQPAAPPPASLPPPQPHAARPVLRATWSFQTTPDACVALAKAGATSLQVAIRPEGPIRLTLALPATAPDKPEARFNGPAGRWQIQGSRTNSRETLFILSRNETSLSRILMLLSGGVLNLEPPQPDMPILSLPESGVDGQRWFACARRNVM